MPLKIMLVDSDRGRGALLRRALEDVGHEVDVCRARGLDLLTQLRQSAANVVIIDMEMPDRDTLESLRSISRENPRPVVMYADKTDAQTTTAAIKAGVSAYVVGEVNAERVRPIVEVAIARFGEFQALREELERTQNTLAGRKVVERAKGLLMQRRKMDEQTAYATLRKLAMDRNQRLVDVARTLIELSDVLG